MFTRSCQTDRPGQQRAGGEHDLRAQPDEHEPRDRDRRGGAMRSSGGIVQESRSARVNAARGLPDVLDDDRREPSDKQAANATAPTATSTSGRRRARRPPSTGPAWR